MSQVTSQTLNTWAVTKCREKEKAIVDAVYAKEAAEEARLAAHSAVASRVATRQAIALREAFTGPVRVRPPPPKATMPRPGCKG